MGYTSVTKCTNYSQLVHLRLKGSLVDLESEIG